MTRPGVSGTDQSGSEQGLAPALTLLAPAKVNLYLHVTGRRADGYHLLDSLVAFCGVGDVIEFFPDAGPLRLSVTGPQAAALLPDRSAVQHGLSAGQPDAANDDNIILRAARRLAERAGCEPQGHIRLTKNLPVASGIGGGSSDAATTLLGLNRLWGLHLPADQLAGLGLSLGADLPVCLRRLPTAMSGVGEHLDTPPPLPPAWLLLINPGIGLSTPAVFKARQGGFSAPAPLDCAGADATGLAQQLALRHNDLTPPALQLLPQIADGLQALAAQPGCLLARMSGSGATCFGLFASQQQARMAETALAGILPGWWRAAGPLLTSALRDGTGTSSAAPEQPEKMLELELQP